MRCVPSRAVQLGSGCAACAARGSGGASTSGPSVIVEVSPSSGTLIVTCIERLPGALAVIVYVPGSVGSATPHWPGPTATVPRSTRKPGGARVVRHHDAQLRELGLERRGARARDLFTRAFGGAMRDAATSRNSDHALALRPIAS